MRNTVAKVLNKVGSQKGSKVKELKRNWNKTPGPVRHELRVKLIKELEK